MFLNVFSLYTFSSTLECFLIDDSVLELMAVYLNVLET